MISTEDKTVQTEEISTDIERLFPNAPRIIEPLMQQAKTALSKIENILYTSTSFIEVLKGLVPQETLQAILTDEQKLKIAKGTLKVMAKKDGSLMANLIDPKTKKIVDTISLEKVKLTPELGKAMSSFSSQMQMAQIAEQIQSVQIAIEEVRQGQENDRLAIAYSCEQKFLQAMMIKNPILKNEALMRIAFDAEDSRNLLMLSQKTNATFIRNQPESLIGKIIKGENQKKINDRMNELRDGLNAVNMVSLVEAMSYNELGEPEAAKQCLLFYSDFLNKTYLSYEGFLERLDSIDPSPKNYWSNTLPQIKGRIYSLSSPTDAPVLTLGEKENEEQGKG